MASLMDRLKEYIGSGATGRKARIDHAIDQQSRGKNSKGSTLGNPAGPAFKRKKKKINTSSKRSLRKRIYG